jgi:hypothetical protein
VKRDIGELSWRPFLLGLFVFLISGVLFYLQFDFRQVQPNADRDAENKAHLEAERLRDRVQRLEAVQDELGKRVDGLQPNPAARIRRGGQSQGR